MRTSEDSLHRETRRWLRELGERAERIESLPGDVSMRRYLRAHLCGGASAIVAVYPEPHDPSLDRFLSTTRLLQQAEIRVPEVRAWDHDAGLVLVEDLGPSTLYDLRDRGWPTLDPYLRKAAAALERVAKLPATEIAALNPPLDEELLRNELEVGWRLFLEPRGLDRERGVGADLNDLLVEVCRTLDRAPWVPAHRDFMARNLIPLPEGDVAVLDHQDLRLGSPTYDIASLLNDSLYPPPEACARLRRLAGQESTPSPLYHAAVVQRTLKIIGTFERFARRGGVRYRTLIPPSVERFLAALEHVSTAGRRLRDELASLLRRPPQGPTAGLPKGSPNQASPGPGRGGSL